jgi:hypothetical protein
MRTADFSAFAEGKWHYAEFIYRKPGEGSCVVLRVSDKEGGQVTINLFYGGDDEGPAFVQLLKDAIQELHAECPTCEKE